MKIPQWLQKLFKGGITALQVWDWIVWSVGLLAIIVTFVWGFIRDVGPVIIPIGLLTIAGFFIVRERFLHYLSTKSQNIPAQANNPLSAQNAPLSLPGQKVDQELSQKVFVFKGEVDLTNLDKANPFVAFTFWFFNGSSTNQIYFLDLKGHVRFNNEEQSPEVELLGDMNTKYELGKNGFRIRQFITDLAARTIRQTISGPGATHGLAQFRFDAVYLTIARVGDESEAGYRLDLPTISKRDETTWITHI